MNDEHCDHCGGREPLTRERAQLAAHDFLLEAAEHINGGRVSEAQLLNQIAQTMLALADRLVPQAVEGPVH